MFADISSDDVLKLAVPFAGAIIATFAGFYINQRHANQQEKIKELKQYIVALESTANELAFYAEKCVQLSAALGKIVADYRPGMASIVVPSYSVYPSFLESCKGTLSGFFKNSELVRTVGHCHFELCHILERINQLKMEADALSNQTDYRNSLHNAIAVTANAESFKKLLDLNIKAFRDAVEALNAEKSKTQIELRTEKERSLFAHDNDE